MSGVHGGLSVANRGRAVLVVAAALLLMLAGPRAAWAALVWDFNNPPANGYTLEQVNDAGGLEVGGLLFANFGVISSATSGVVGPKADTITVQGIESGPSAFSLQFNGGWAVNSGQAINTTIDFSVTALDSEQPIIANWLWMSGYGASGEGLVQITENVYPSNPGLIPPPSALGDKFISYAQGDPQNNTVDSAEFDPHGQVWVVKDISVSGGQVSGGNAHLSQFYQAFVQVPEPGSLALLAAGGLLALRRRPRHRAGV